MGHAGGHAGGPRAALQEAAAGNASRTEGAGLGASGSAQLLLEILMVLMCLGAVAGNILVIVIVAATKTFHSVTSVLIMNLAVSDLLVGLGVMPFVALSIWNRGWVNCTDLCQYVGYTSSVYCTASVLTLAAIALDRYHSIVHCLRYSARCTLWTCAAVLWIWMQALATSCPPLLGWSSVSYVAPMYSCTVNWASTPSYTAFMAALCYLLPAAVILFCYVNIVKVARSHARRIHSLEDSVQRSRGPRGPPLHHCGSLRGPTTLICHVSGQFVSEVRRQEEEGRGYLSAAPPHSTTEPRGRTPRGLFSFLAPQPPPQSSPHHHHGVVRLFLVISAFFLCWTPYIGVALVQATETALSRRPSLVPPSAVTFSYWLVLLNSDINPLLYALLSRRFQGALRGLRQKVRARVGGVVGRGRGARPEGEDGDPSTQTTAPPAPPSGSEAFSSSIFTVSSELQQQSEEHLCKVCHHDNASPLCRAWRGAAGADGRRDRLQVPSGPPEGATLPFSALTRERQATFFYGQITVRVEHDVC